MPNGTCHGCSLNLNEFLTESGRKLMEKRVKAMAPWPIGTNARGGIRHREIEPTSRCNGVIWYYADDPTPPAGEKYMGWLSNPVVATAMQTLGKAPPPKPRPIQRAVLQCFGNEGQPLASYDVTQEVRQLHRTNGCLALTAGQPLWHVLSECGALTEASLVCGAGTDPEAAADDEATDGAQAQELRQELAAADSNAEVAMPMGASLAVTVDGSTHEFDALRADMNIRKALRC